ncbi:hypothetical protein U1Q18_024223 [Sarracenia purpurea var. burkii]
MGTYHHFDYSDAHLPPGFRFHPTDEELVTYYLLKKVLDSNFTGRAIAEVDLNKCEPWELPGKFSYHFLSRSSKDEWVISRVFQKSGSAVAGGGGKKYRLMNTGINLYPEVSSPSSVYLPPLPDSSAAVTDHESCSYDGSAAEKEHVPCFSTTATNLNPHPYWELPPPPLTPLNPAPDPSSSRFSTNVGLQAFPNLRSLQENLQMPFFFSAVVAPRVLDGGNVGGCSAVGNWTVPDNEKVDCGKMPLGPTELDCMWSFSQ